MDALEMTLLFDYYGDLLTERQRLCFDLRHNQDLSLAEIAEELQVSRQSIHDILSRTEAQLRNMEAKTGCVGRDMRYRKAMAQIVQLAKQIADTDHEMAASAARKIIAAADALEE